MSKHAHRAPKRLRGGAPRPAAPVSAKHRQAPAPVSATPRKALSKAVVLSGIAVAATGATVGGGVALTGGGQATQVAAADDLARGAEVARADVRPDDTADASSRAELSEELAERSQGTVSRSTDRRVEVDPTKAAALAQAASKAARAVTEQEDVTDDDPRTIASAMLKDFGWGADQFGCLDSLWTRESNWRVDADNPSSSAYGIPQALPGSKMASAGPDWATNPATQIKWGLGYIQDRYGSPCGAWAHSESSGWY